MIKSTPKKVAYVLTKDPVAARLLEQLHFRYKGAVAKGKLATPQSYQDLMRDTGFSYKMVKRGLHVLRSLGLILSEQHLFLCKNVAHYVIPNRVGQMLEGQLPLPAGPTATAPEGQLYIAGTSSETSSGTSLGNQPAAVAMTGDFLKKEAAGEGGEGKTFNKDAPEIASQETDMKLIEWAETKAYADKAMKLLHKPNTPSSLETLWKHKVSEVHPMLGTIGPKEKGQFKHFRNACPPDAADEVMTWVLNDWSHFSYKVSQGAGVKHAPTLPNLGFLLRHVKIAVTYWAISKSPKKQEAKPAIPVDKTVQLPSLASKHNVMSWEELLADPDEG